MNRRAQHEAKIENRDKGKKGVEKVQNHHHHHLGLPQRSPIKYDFCRDSLIFKDWVSFDENQNPN